MVMSMEFIISFIVSAVALFVGIFVFAGVDDAFVCTGIGADSCEQGKATAWTVVGIFPIVLFFSLFTILGSFGSGKV